MRAALDQFVRDLRPDDPLEVVFPKRLARNAGHVLSSFGGRVLYAVKCNSQPAVLLALWEGGIRDFDVASLDEIALVRGLFPDAGIHYMHPVKPRAAIACAMRDYGVSTFAVDCQSELDKVLTEAEGFGPVDILVRLALPFGRAGRDQSGKFGISADLAAQVLKAARPAARCLGLTFHVGSQCLDPRSFVEAIILAKQAQSEAGIKLDVLDVGGGFPASYDECVPPPFQDFVDAIKGEADAPQLWCEPGRALVASGQSLVVRVVGRKGNGLFLNDGIYGGLAPEPVAGHRYSARLITADGRKADDTGTPFVLFGPTCDSYDRLPLPYRLPGNVQEGDWIVLDNTGAYAGALRSRFNGMGAAKHVIWEG